MAELKIRDDQRRCTYLLELDDSGSQVIKIIMELDEPKPVAAFFSLQSGLMFRPPPTPRREHPSSEITIAGAEVRKCPNCGAMMVKEGCCGGQERWRCTRCSYRSL